MFLMPYQTMEQEQNSNMVLEEQIFLDVLFHKKYT